MLSYFQFNSNFDKLLDEQITLTKGTVSLEMYDKIFRNKRRICNGDSGQENNNREKTQSRVYNIYILSSIALGERTIAIQK